MAATRSSEGAAPACPLCEADGGELVWRDDRLRVILAAAPDYPGFTRVVWNRHVAEMTDLPARDRNRLMSVVWLVEAAQREALVPDKINLACFGNLVPHLHWHLVPRWGDDRHFPEPVWAQPADRSEARVATRIAAVRVLLPAYLGLLRTRLA